MPEMTRRSSTRRAPGWFVGRCGAIVAHCVSDSQNKALMTPPANGGSESRSSHNLKRLNGFGA